MAKTPPSEEQLASWLDEHLPYELSMLRYSFMKMKAPTEPLDYNAHYECFAVKARLFWDFIGCRDVGPTNVKATHFAPNFDPPDREHIQEELNLLNPQVMHTGRDRPKDPAKKISLDNCLDFGLWVENGMELFLKALPSERRRLWNADKARDDLKITRSVSPPASSSSIRITTTDSGPISSTGPSASSSIITLKSGG